MRNLKETNGRKFEEELRITKGNAVENDRRLKNLCEAEVVVVDEACMLEAEKYAAAIEAVKNGKSESRTPSPCVFPHISEIRMGIFPHARTKAERETTGRGRKRGRIKLIRT